MESWEGAQLNQAKEILAFELTKLVHGEEEANKAREASHALFAGGGDSAHMPTVELSPADFADGDMDILSLLVKTELAPSRSDARRAVEMSDYDSVVRILNQGQALHINWRPDIYKPNDALLPKAVFEEIVKGDTFYIAENEGNVIGILELIFRHIESPAQVTRDIVFIDTMAVDEPYRGMGVGHLFFEKVKEIKAKKRLDGIELQVNAKNQAAYEMYCNYGFTEKSINMELL